MLKTFSGINSLVFEVKITRAATSKKLDLTEESFVYVPAEKVIDIIGIKNNDGEKFNFPKPFHLENANDPICFSDFTKFFEDELPCLLREDFKQFFSSKLSMRNNLPELCKSVWTTKDGIFQHIFLFLCICFDHDLTMSLLMTDKPHIKDLKYEFNNKLEALGGILTNAFDGLMEQHGTMHPENLIMFNQILLVILGQRDVIDDFISREINDIQSFDYVSRPKMSLRWYWAPPEIPINKKMTQGAGKEEEDIKPLVNDPIKDAKMMLKIYQSDKCNIDLEGFNLCENSEFFKNFKHCNSSEFEVEMAAMNYRQFHSFNFLSAPANPYVFTLVSSRNYFNMISAMSSGSNCLLVGSSQSGKNESIKVNIYIV
jgi:hypothetical protein